MADSPASVGSLDPDTAISRGTWRAALAAAGAVCAAVDDVMSGRVGGWVAGWVVGRGTGRVVGRDWGFVWVLAWFYGARGPCAALVMYLAARTTSRMQGVGACVKGWGSWCRFGGHGRRWWCWGGSGEE